MNAENNPSAFISGLRLFTHPLVIASIGLLLLNDHLLKTAFPSPITGKISDFTGLFFFPFLLIVVYGSILDQFRVPVPITAILAFGTTAILFTLIKTSPAVNDAIQQIGSYILGYPIQIIVDATDLLALVSLKPAWSLWQQYQRKRPLPVINRSAYLLLGVASVATIATSPCEPKPRVTQVIAFNDAIYIPGIYSNRLTYSDDLGQTWEYPLYDEVPEGARQAIQPERTMPVVVCEPDNEAICYRITGEAKVEESTDDGYTWRVIWQVPLGRQEFMQTYSKRTGSRCGEEVDMGFYDLALINRNGETSIIVASGNEGILVRDGAGNWHRRFGATPLYPLSLTDLFRLLIFETIFFLGATVITWISVSYTAWKHMLYYANKKPQLQQKVLSFTPILASIVVFILAMIAIPLWYSAVNNILLSRSSPLANVRVGFLQPIFSLLHLPPLHSLGAIALINLGYLALFIGPLVGWRRILTAIPEATPAIRHTMRLCIIISGVVLSAWVPFALWTFGILPFYFLAFVLSGGIFIIALKKSVSSVQQSSKTVAALIE